jgi:RecG-like helicase
MSRMLQHQQKRQLLQSLPFEFTDHPNRTTQNLAHKFHRGQESTRILNTEYV